MYVIGDYMSGGNNVTVAREFPSDLWIHTPTFRKRAAYLSLSIPLLYHDSIPRQTTTIMSRPYQATKPSFASRMGFEALGVEDLESASESEHELEKELTEVVTPPPPPAPVQEPPPK